MPSKAAVTLVSYRKTDNNGVVPAGESKHGVGGHCDDSSTSLRTLRNRDCPRVLPHRGVSLMHSNDTDKSSHLANQPNMSGAACMGCHGNKQITCGNHDDRPSVSCGEGVKIGDARDINTCERSVSEADDRNVVTTAKELEHERCGVRVDRESLTKTNGRVDGQLSVQRETSDEDDVKGVVSLDVGSGSEHISFDSAVSGSGDHDGAVSGGGDDDSVVSGGGDDGSVVSGGSDHDSSISGGGDHDSTVSEGGDHDSAVSGGVDHDSTLSGGGDYNSAASGGGNHNDASQNQPETDIKLVSETGNDTVMQYLLLSVPRDDSRNDSQSSDEQGWTRLPGRPRRSPVELDLHHGLRLERGNSDDYDSFLRFYNSHRFHMDNDDDDDDDYLSDLPLSVLRYIDDDNDDDDDDGTSMSLTSSEPDLSPPFVVGELRHVECSICLETRSLHVRVCCACAACDDCLARYYTAQVRAACIRVRCVGCDAHVPRDEIIFRLDDDAKRQFDRFLVDANRDPRIKTCPRCSVTTQLDAHAQLGQPEGLQVTCADCHLDWCFTCQAPWHDGATCRQYRKGDKLLKTWARQQQRGQANAQKCPHCKTYIQRTTGCDHMTCTQCHTEFCYACGGRYYRLKYLGSHYSRLSILGCRKNFKPNKPVQRRLIRGTLFGLNVLSLPILAALAVGAGVVVAGAGVVAMPVYGSYKLHKHLQRKKALKRKKERRLTFDLTRVPASITAMTSDDTSPYVSIRRVV